MVFCEKIPSEEELEEHYSNNYDLTRYLSPITIDRYNTLLDEMEAFRKTGKILDIGAGYGFFLEIAKRRGWEVHGTELTEDLIQQCEKKGFTMHQGEIDSIDFKGVEFDVIVSIEVIEHVKNPKNFVSHASKVLRSGGLFYLSTPNFNSYLRYRLKEKYNIIDYPNHLNYFTSKTLKRLFNDNGYQTQRIKTTGISMTRLRTSKGKGQQLFVSETSDDEMIRYRIERNGFLRFGKRFLNGILNLFKIGDSLKGSFIKK